MTTLTFRECMTHLMCWCSYTSHAPEIMFPQSQTASLPSMVVFIIRMMIVSERLKIEQDYPSVSHKAVVRPVS